MALVLVSAVGGASSNSFLSLSEAESYFEGRPFAAAWTGSTTALKEQALVYATTLLDRERWAGAKGVSYTSALTQALAWPRRWATTLEVDAAPQLVSEWFIDTATGYYSALTIPQPIQRATCELALEILRAGDADPFTKDSTRNVKRKRIDVLETEYFDVGQRARGLALYPSVAALIAPLLRGVSSAHQIERV